ncbi:hypothetical protein LguiA_001773 [Lonicera macranthoides]
MMRRERVYVKSRLDDEKNKYSMWSPPYRSSPLALHYRLSNTTSTPQSLADYQQYLRTIGSFEELIYSTSLSGGYNLGKDMDKSWILSRNRNSKEYIDGVQGFINFAFMDKSRETYHIKCPCIKCVNRFYHNLENVMGHIEMYGFDRSYRNWIYHGENFNTLGSSNDNFMDGIALDDAPVESNFGANMTAMVQEGIEIPHINDDMGNEEQRTEGAPVSNDNMPTYFKLLKEAETELYENCPTGVTELSFVVELLNLKQLNGWTNRSFTMLLELLRKVFPNAKIPKSWYLANKLTTDLGFNYETWDAYPNSCMLFKDQYENLEKWNICEVSRYKKVVVDEGYQVEQDKHVKRVPEKRISMVAYTRMDIKCVTSACIFTKSVINALIKSALSELEKSLKDHYAKLWNYGAEILKSNPSSTVKIIVGRHDPNRPHISKNVKRGEDGYTVDLKNRTCACRMGDLFGIPCYHAISAIYYIKEDPIKYVSGWFYIEEYKKSYKYFLQPLNGEKLWPMTELQPFLPPPSRRMFGRPRKNRITKVKRKAPKSSSASTVEIASTVSKIALSTSTRPRKIVHHNSAAAKKKDKVPCGYRVYISPETRKTFYNSRANKPVKISSQSSVNAPGSGGNGAIEKFRDRIA